VARWNVDLMDEHDGPAQAGRCRSISPLKVIADTGNGAVGPALTKLYAKLFVHDTDVLRADGNFCPTTA